MIKINRLFFLFLIILVACSSRVRSSPIQIPQATKPLLATSTPLPTKSSPTLATMATNPPAGLPVTPPNQLTLLEQIGKGTAEQIVWSPDGKFLAVVGSLGVTLYDTIDFKFDRLLPSRVPLIALAFAPNSKKIAVSTKNGNIEFWAFPSGILLSEIPLDGHPVTGLGFSKDGSKLVTGTQGGPISVINVDTARIERQTQQLLSYQSLLAVNQARELVAVADDDDTIHLVDLNSLQTLALLKAHNNFVVALAFSQDGTMLASASVDGALLLWDIRSQTSPHILKAIGATEAEAPYGSPPAFFWNPGIYTDTNWSPALLFSPDNRFVMAGALDGIGRGWLTNYNSSDTFYPADRSAAFSPDGFQFASIAPSGIIQIDTYKKSEEYEFKYVLEKDTEISDFSGPIRSLTVSSASTTVLTSDLRCFHTWSKSGPSSWQQNEFFFGITQFGTFFPASDSNPTMSELVAGGQGGGITIWNGKTGEYEQIFSAHPDVPGLNGIAGVESILFSPSGSTFASIGISGDVKIWNAKNLKGIFAGILEDSHSLAFDAAGDLLAYVGKDDVPPPNNIIRIVDTETGEPVERIPTAADASVIAISLEGEEIAIGQPNGEMEIFSIPTAHLLYQLNLGKSLPTAAIFLKDPRYLIVGTQDGAFQLWNIPSQKLISEVKANQDSVTVLKPSNDGNLLYSGSEDGTVKVWKLTD